MTTLEHPADEYHYEDCEHVMGPPGPFPCNCDGPRVIPKLVAEVERLRSAERQMRDFIDSRYEANRNKGGDDDSYQLEPSIILRAYDGLDPWG
jgi:hypothetical protein